MKATKNFMHARRPIELVLLGVLLLLLGFGAWSYMAGKNTQEADKDLSQTQTDTDIEGTTREIDASTERELVETNLLEDNTEELRDTDLYESAADNFGGAYDESAY